MTTPYYVYDLDLLEQTLQNLTLYAGNYKIHYAIKANSDFKINSIISSYGLGADCVSGNEILHAIQCGYDSKDIVFAGVGKTDAEITTAIEKNIGCLNVESLQEVEVINCIATAQRKHVNLAIRVNPNVDADTHQYIKTGIEENKFGISPAHLFEIVDYISQSRNLCLTGLHFHIGSQITNFKNFEFLAKKVNHIYAILNARDVKIKHLNLGGGLGIDYSNPTGNSIPDFETYFNVFRTHLNVNSDCEIHFELGRSIVGQCGELLTKVLYVKQGIYKNFAVVDAGMTDLLRPALYQAKHNIEKLAKNKSLEKKKYDIVGPICESSDVFRKNYSLEELTRGDVLSIKSCGAYGEVMCSSYNLRDRPKKYYLKNEKKSKSVQGLRLAYPTYCSLKKTVRNKMSTH